MAASVSAGEPLEAAVVGLRIVDDITSQSNSSMGQQQTSTNQAQLYDRRVDPTISLLEALPEELRRQILRYVLHTKFARLAQPVREVGGNTVTRARTFDWTIGVLQVCKTLYYDGKDILHRENRWINITTGFFPMDEDFHWTSLINFDVQFIRRDRAQGLKNQLANIRITSQDDRPPPTFFAQFLIPLEEVPNFASYLVEMDITNHMNYNIHMNVPSKVDLPLQRRALTPFGIVTGEGGTQLVRFDGHINPTLARKMRKAMTAEVGWLRVKAWEIRRRAEHLMSLGAQAFRAGDYAAAAHKYGQYGSFYGAAMDTHSLAKNIDQALMDAYLHNDMISWTNEILAKLRGGLLTHDLFFMDGNVQGSQECLNRWRDLECSASVTTMAAFAMGIGQLRIRKPRVAKATFQWALSYCTGETERDTYRRAITIAEAYSISTETERADDIASLEALLPQEPLPAVERLPRICDVAAAEKHVCKEICKKLNLKLQSTSAYLESFIKEGISIRVLRGADQADDRVLGLFALGEDAYTTEDINLLEVLLHKRLHDDWRHGRHRGQSPRLCQVGHIVEDALDRKIHEYATSWHTAQSDLQRQKALMSIVGRDKVGDTKLWIHLPAHSIGHTSASRDEQQRVAILAEWHDRTAESRSRFEELVAGMAAKYHRLY